MARHLEHLPNLAESAVRYRIRKKWERRRAESAGRSEAFLPAHPRFGRGEVVLNHRELSTIPARPATRHWDAQPERPRPPKSVRIRLVQPR